MKTKKDENNVDKYVRNPADLPPLPIGFTLTDWLSRNPGPEISRISDTGVATKLLVLNRDPLQILCPGAAIGQDAQKICRHLHPSNETSGFIGFVKKNMDQDKVLVQVQGGFRLSVPDADVTEVGRDVFASGPNEFSLSAADGHKIGKILYIEKTSRAMVVFQSYLASKKMVLNFKMKTAKFL